MDYYWKSALDGALEACRGDVEHRYLQLATIDDDGYPANRTVVFRGFSDAGELMVVTDQRSAKARQLGQNPKVEVSWYFARIREQFRIRGQMCMVDEIAARADERLAAWHRLSDAAREQFFWPSPGEPVFPQAADPVSHEPPPHFLLLLLDPVCVDHLQLGHSPQLRYLSRRLDNGWEARQVNP